MYAYLHLLAYLAQQALYNKQLTVDEVHEISKIDTWFLRRLERIANYSHTLTEAKSLDALGKEVREYVFISRLCLSVFIYALRIQIIDSDHEC